MKACCWLKLRNLGKWSSMASFTEMNPMYATIQESPPASHSPLPSVASHRDTATSQTALLNPYDRPERDEAAETSAYPSGSKRLDAESTIYGKAPPEEKQKKVAILDSVDYHSRDCPWTGIQSCTFLVLPVLACVFAAAVLILTLLIAFGVLQGEQTAAEQMKSLNSALATLDGLNQTLAELQAQLDMTGACPNSTSPPLPATSSLLLHTVNFSDCVQFTSSCNFSADSPCTTGPNSTTPAFLNASLTERTQVVVEQSCWVSDIVGDVSELQTANRIFTVENTSLYVCDCSAGNFGTGAAATCHFYFRECALSSVRVQQP